MKDYAIITFGYNWKCILFFIPVFVVTFIWPKLRYVCISYIVNNLVKSVDSHSCVKYKEVIFKFRLVVVFIRVVLQS